jgi:competence protein ComEC
LATHINFWDTANTKDFAPGSFGSRTDLEADWDFYKNLRDTDSDTDPKRLAYYSGNSYDYFKQDGQKVLTPTPDLVAAGNKKKNWNDASYVILYRACDKKILLSGDSEDKTCEHILTEWEEDVSNLDVLIAPHHGRTQGATMNSSA